MGLVHRWCAGWREHLKIVRPDTVVRWHRQAWRLFWRWKSPCGAQNEAQGGRRTRDRHTPPRMSRPPDHPRRAPPLVCPPRIRGLLQRGTTTPDARVADAGSEATAGDRSDPVAAGTEWTPLRLRTRRLTALDVCCPTPAADPTRRPGMSPLRGYDSPLWGCKSRPGRLCTLSVMTFERCSSI